MADPHAVDRAQDGVGHDRRLIGQKGAAEQGQGGEIQHLVAQGQQMRGPSHRRITRRNSGEKGQRRPGDQGGNQGQLPCKRCGRRQGQPARHRSADPSHRRQGPAQVVGHFQPGKAAQAGFGAEKIGQQLPIPPRPTVLARSVDVILHRKILDKLHIAGQGRPGKAAFQKVMRQNRVFADPAVRRGPKGVDVIDAFASERAFGQQVLIGVRGRENIRVQPAMGGKDPLENRRLGPGRQRWRDARLQNPVPRADPTLWPDDGAVDRMRQLAHQGRN